MPIFSAKCRMRQPLRPWFCQFTQRQQALWPLLGPARTWDSMNWPFTISIGSIDCETLMQDTMWLQNARNADAPADGCAPEDLWKCEGAEGHRQGWEDAAAREEEGAIWGNYFIIHFKWCRKNYFHKNQRFDLYDLLYSNTKRKTKFERSENDQIFNFWRIVVIPKWRKVE